MSNMLQMKKKEYIIFRKSEKKIELKWLFRKKKKKSKIDIFDIMFDILMIF